MFDVIRSTVNAFSQTNLGPWHSLGDTLLVGEGNMSFAKSLLYMPQVQIEKMTVTTFDGARNLSEKAAENAAFLKCVGAEILHDIDATRLEEIFKTDSFDTVIFQFPNVGSRDPKYGRNPNYIMLRKFLRSAAACLKPFGKVLVSAVDNSYYQGAFQFDEAAAFAGYDIPEIYPFDPSMFPGYAHTNTNDGESAINNHDRFATLVFRPEP